MDIEYDNLDYFIDETNGTATLTGGKGLFDSIIQYPGFNQQRGLVVEIPEYVEYDGKKFLVTTIKGRTFDCAIDIVELIIPSSVKSFHWGMYNCHQLKTFHVSDNNRFLYDNNGVLFSKQRRELIAYPNKHGEEYTIPEGTTIIGNMAFKSCSNLKKVIIPPSVIRMGINVFYDCGETDIYIPNNFTIEQVYSKNSDISHYDKLRFHLCGEIYTVELLNKYIKDIKNQIK